MTIRKTKIPAIPLPTPGEAQPVLDALKEATEVGLGRRGDPLDRFVTVRELKSAGIVNGNGSGAVGAGALTGGGGSQTPVDVTGTINGLPDNRPPDYGQNDYTVPPMPTHVVCQSIPPNLIMVTFDPPNFGNYAYAEVFMVPASANSNLPVTYTQFLALSGAFSTAKPCTGTSGTNANTFFVGTTTGSSLSVSLTASELGNSGGVDGITLGAALNPPAVYVFVRFVSFANVCGPFGPPDIGASGHGAIDPILVLDLMTAQVQASALYTNLTQFIGTDPALLAQLKADGGVTQVYNNTTKNAASLNTIWSVRMAQQLNDGTTVSAGFGLGITSDATNGSATSLFAVMADQFAVFSPSGNVYLIDFISGGSNPSNPVASFQLNIPGAFSGGDTVVVRPANGAVGGYFNNLEGTITDDTNGLPSTRTTWNVQLNVVDLPSGTGDNTGNGFVAWPSFDGGAYTLTKASNIPFIIDTQTGAIGIRGKLIVDGLIRATSGQFDTLTANSAFIQSLRASIINANIVCGQKIIAGAGIPDSVIVNGSISDTALSQLDGWIVELSKPAPGGHPFRIYNPARQGLPGGVLLDLYGGDPAANAYPYLTLTGDLRVGGGGVFNMRNGGAAAFGVVSNDNIVYTFWCGADADYATTHTNMDGNGAFWIRPTIVGVEDQQGQKFRAGFNLDLFLGKNAFALPSIGSGAVNPGCTYTVNPGDGQKTGQIQADSLVITVISASSILIRALRDGTNAPTVITVSGFLASYYGDGTTSDNGNSKMMTLSADLVTAGGSIVQNIQFIAIDDWYPETLPFNLQNIISVAAGTYYVRVTVQRLNDRSMSICQGWTCVAFQGAANGAMQ